MAEGGGSSGGAVTLEALDAALADADAAVTDMKDLEERVHAQMKTAMAERVAAAADSREPDKLAWACSLIQELFDELCARVPRRSDMHAALLTKLKGTGFTDAMAPSSRAGPTRAQTTHFTIYVVDHLREMEDAASADHAESECVAAAATAAIEATPDPFRPGRALAALLDAVHAWLREFDRRLVAHRTRAK